MKNLRNSTIQRSGHWRPTVSFWITASVLLLLILLSAASSGVSGVLILLGIFGLLTGLYALVFKRKSWAGISSRKVGAVVAVSGLIVTIAGGAAAGPAPAPPKNQVVAVAETTAASMPTPTPPATETSPSLSPCTTKAATKQYQEQDFVCTLARNGKLVWLEKAASKKLVADLAAEKTAADKATADKAAAQRVAAEKAAAEQAEAQRVAAEKAAAEQAEAQRVAAEKAAEQAHVQPAPVQEAPLAPAPAYVHPGAFCSGGTGVSKTGKPMVCAPGSDGRLRWQSP